MLRLNPNNFPAPNSSPSFRTWYSGGIVGLAIFLVAISLAKPQTIAVQYECEVLAPSVRDPNRAQLVTSQPSVADMRSWLLNGDTDGASASNDLRVEWSCNNPDALVIRVVGNQVSESRGRTRKQAEQLAKLLNQHEQQVLKQHQELLASRVNSARQRVATAENNLALIVADLKEAAAKSATAAAISSQSPPDYPSSAKIDPTPAPRSVVSEFRQEPVRIANPQWTLLQHELQQATLQVQSLAGRFTANHPLMQSAQLQVDAINARLEVTPQYLPQAEIAQPVVNPPAAPQTESREDELPPIAGRGSIRRTDWQTPTLAPPPALQPFVEDFQRQSRELASARHDVTQAEDALRNFTSHLVAANTHPAIVVKGPNLVSHRRQIPQNIFLWALVGSLVAAALFANYATDSSPALLATTDQVLSNLGMPVLSTVVGRRVVRETDGSESPKMERQILAAAELTVIVIVTAFLISYVCDQKFAEVVAADPLVAISEVWKRG